MLAEARRLASAEGLGIRWVEGRAEATGLAPGSFDAVTAGTCWHWFDAHAAAAEALRVLRPGGRLAIASLDWLPLPGNVVEATVDLIRSFGSPSAPERDHTGIHREWALPVRMAGFRDLEFFGFDHDLAYTREAWRGRIRASAGVGATLPPGEVARFDAAHAAMLGERFPDDPLAVAHRVFCLVARKPG
jgi:SAM-dependent methyltransferase